MKTIFALLFFCFSLHTFAQDVQKRNNRIDFYWQLYACNFQFKGDSYEAFQKSLPNSAILGNSNYISEGNSFVRGTGTSTALSFGVGIPVRIFKSTKFTNTLRVGFDGIGKLGFGAETYNEKRIRIDSTYYPQYNTSLMKDSVYFDQNGALITGSLSQVKMDLLFRFRPEKRFTFYSGIGVGITATTNRKAEITRRSGNFSEVYTSIIDSNDNNYSSDYYQEQSGEVVAQESYKLKTGYSFYSYIPFGLDLKLGSKDNLLSKFHLYTEGQLGVRFSDVFLNAKQTTFHTSATLGIRVCI